MCREGFALTRLIIVIQSEAKNPLVITTGCIES